MSVRRSPHRARRAVAIVTFNRPRVLNALNAETLDALRRTILDLKNDDGVRVVILTGAGDKAFVAGADINELAVQTPTSARAFALAGQHVFDPIEQLGKPVIAADQWVRARAAGASWPWRARCGSRPTRRRFGQPEINLGLIPGYAGSQRLRAPRRQGQALELLLTGVPISAGEAQRLGLVNRVVAASELMNEAKTLADAARREGADRDALHPRRVNRASRCRSRKRRSTRPRCSGGGGHRRHARGHAGVSREAQPAFKGRSWRGASIRTVEGTPAAGSARGGRRVPLSTTS